MAKPKLKKKTSADHGASKTRSLMESAQQIWMAGMGAFTRAQGEGSKLFEGLVKEGLSLEQKTRQFATGKVDEARDAVESKVAQVKERAADTWDRLETVFEDRVSKALNKLGVPGRDEMQALIARVEELNRTVRKLGPTKAEASAGRASMKRSMSKAKQGVALVAQAAGEAQMAAAKVVKTAVRKARKAIK